jgi:hypothetical protein
MHSAQLTLHVKKLQQSLNFKRLLLLFDLVGKLDSPTSLPFAVSLKSVRCERAHESKGRSIRPSLHARALDVDFNRERGAGRLYLSTHRTPEAA